MYSARSKLERKCQRCGEDNMDLLEIDGYSKNKKLLLREIYWSNHETVKKYNRLYCPACHPNIMTVEEWLGTPRNNYNRYTKRIARLRCDIKDKLVCQKCGEDNILLVKTYSESEGSRKERLLKIRRNELEDYEILCDRCSDKIMTTDELREYEEAITKPNKYGVIKRLSIVKKEDIEYNARNDPVLQKHKYVAGFEKEFDLLASYPPLDNGRDYSDFWNLYDKLENEYEFNVDEVLEKVYDINVKELLK